MDMRQEWLTALRAWAAHNSNVRELWLFGSRAKGTADAQSDVDIALLLMPPTDNINWALAAYVEFFDDWKAELRVALNREVSLVAIGSGYEMNTEVRATGISWEIGQSAPNRLRGRILSGRLDRRVWR